MLTLLCDRCKKVIDDPEHSNFYSISRGKTMDCVNEVDLCDSCYKKFIKWIEEGKENEE